MTTFTTKPAHELQVGDSFKYYQDEPSRDNEEYADVTIASISDTESGIELHIYTKGSNGGNQQRILMPRFHQVRIITD